MTGKVKAALIANPDTKAYQINVDTLQGVVHLQGAVDNPESQGNGRNGRDVGKGREGSQKRFDDQGFLTRFPHVSS